MSRSVPYLSELDIELDAAALLDEYEHARGRGLAPPIPIEDIVEKYLKLAIDFDDLHRVFGVPRLIDPSNGPDILGAMFFEEARIVIDEYLDPEENPDREGRYRFTLAHEGGGHWRLHRHLFLRDTAQGSFFERPAGGSAVVCRSSQAKERIEWQADYYASCLLMPRKLVSFAWQRRFGSQRPFIFEYYRQDSSWRRPQSTWMPIVFAVRNALPSSISTSAEAEHSFAFDKIARDLARDFAVSTLAMRIRLEGLGLLLRHAPGQEALKVG